MRKFFQWLKKEALHVLPVFLFFLVTLTFINFADSYLIKKANLASFTFAAILVGAALIAKVLVVIDHMPFVNLFPAKPLVYNVLWKTWVYWVFTSIVRVAIRFFPYLFVHQSLDMEYKDFVGSMDWHFFVSIEAFYLMLFFLFVTSNELIQVIGVEKVRKIFFGK